MNFIVKLKAFSYSVGIVALVQFSFLLIGWIIYILLTTGHLGEVPIWIVPERRFFLLWLMALKLLFLLTALVWLILFFWYRRLEKLENAKRD